MRSEPQHPGPSEIASLMQLFIDAVSLALCGGCAASPFGRFTDTASMVVLQHAAEAVVSFQKLLIIRLVSARGAVAEQRSTYFGTKVMVVIVACVMLIAGRHLPPALYWLAGVAGQACHVRARRSGQQPHLDLATSVLLLLSWVALAVLPSGVAWAQARKRAPHVPGNGHAESSSFPSECRCFTFRVGATRRARLSPTAQPVPSCLCSGFGRRR